MGFDLRAEFLEVKDDCTLNRAAEVGMVVSDDA